MVFSLAFVRLHYDKYKSGRLPVWPWSLQHPPVTKPLVINQSLSVSFFFSVNPKINIHSCQFLIHPATAFGESFLPSPPFTKIGLKILTVFLLQKQNIAEKQNNIHKSRANLN